MSAPRFFLAVVVLSAAVGCGSSRSESGEPATPSSSSDPGCRGGAGDDVKMAGRTAGAAAKTGLSTAAAGIVQAGSAAAGLVHGGTDEAGEKWREGRDETKATARKGASETREEARVPRCK